MTYLTMNWKDKKALGFIHKPVNSPFLTTTFNCYRLKKSYVSVRLNRVYTNKVWILIYDMLVMYLNNIFSESLPDIATQYNHLVTPVSVLPIREESFLLSLEFGIIDV